MSRADLIYGAPNLREPLANLNKGRVEMMLSGLRSLVIPSSRVGMNLESNGKLTAHS